MISYRKQNQISTTRSSGILLHITSLPSLYGIGDLGHSSRRFIDFLSEMNQKFWQILPTNDPENFNSPYDANSAFAQNPLLISLDLLLEENILSKREVGKIPNFSKKSVEFEKVKEWKYPILDKAASNFYYDKAESTKYKRFCIQNSFWLDDYAAFKIIKKLQGNSSWKDWKTNYRQHNKELVQSIIAEYELEVHKIKILQYFFYKQWQGIKVYAKKRNVEFIGDIPIYVSYNSADVWSNSKLFKLNQNGSMKFQSGCPPDHFSSRGQLWGHPIYDWDLHLRSNFLWWESRLKYAMKFVDIVRIDHFNGFAKYWEVPIRNKTARKGKWVYSPGEQLLMQIMGTKKNSVKIIAEDLGAAAKDAEKIRKKFGIPGMTILQYEYFNNDRTFLEVEETVLYTGTHDNDTIVGWYLDLAKKSSKKDINLIPNFNDSLNKESNWFFMDVALKSRARTVIIPFQDLIGLGTEGRMNIPGTTDVKNWTWRASDRDLDRKFISRMNTLMKNSKRK